MSAEMNGEIGQIVIAHMASKLRTKIGMDDKAIRDELEEMVEKTGCTRPQASEILMLKLTLVMKQIGKMAEKFAKEV